MRKDEHWFPHSDDKTAGTRRIQENLRLALRAIDAAEGDLGGREKTVGFRNRLGVARHALQAALDKVPR